MLYVQNIAAKRTKNRLWAPGGLRAIAKALTSRGESGEQAVGEDQEASVARKDHVGGRRAEEEFAEEAGWSRWLASREVRGHEREVREYERQVRINE